MSKNGQRLKDYKGILIQEFDVTGYGPGEFLPTAIGSSINLEITGSDLVKGTVTIDLAADGETMVEIARSLLAVAATMGVNLDIDK